MTRSLRVLLFLLVLCLVALAVTGSAMYLRLSYLWGLLLLGSWLWSLTALRGVRMERRARVRRAYMGQIFEERFRIYNTGRLPRLWLELRDLSPLPGARGSRVVTMVKGGQSRSYLARTRLVQRGVFPLGGTVLAASDPFGFFPVHRKKAAEVSLLVYPMIADVQAFPSPSGVLPGGEALRRRTHQVTPNAAGVREYAPGDPQSRIHWPTTARRNRLMVKEFELDPRAEIWIMVDAGQDVQCTLPHAPLPVAADVSRHIPTIALPPSTEEYVVSIAASLAQHFLSHQREVGLVSYTHMLNVLPADRGARQLGKILEALALLRAVGDMPISALAEAQVQHLLRGSTVILITPAVGDDVALTTDTLLRRGFRPVVVLLDAASFGGPSGTQGLASGIGSLGVPVCRVENGMDLGVALSATDVWRAT